MHLLFAIERQLSEIYISIALYPIQILMSVYQHIGTNFALYHIYDGDVYNNVQILLFNGRHGISNQLNLPFQLTLHVLRETRESLAIDFSVSSIEFAARSTVKTCFSIIFYFSYK